MKDKLTAVFNTLRLIETRGDDTIRMADCLKLLSSILLEMYEEEKTQDDNNEEK